MNDNLLAPESPHQEYVGIQTRIEHVVQYACLLITRTADLPPPHPQNQRNKQYKCKPQGLLPILFPMLLSVRVPRVAITITDLNKTSYPKGAKL